MHIQTEVSAIPFQRQYYGYDIEMNKFHYNRLEKSKAKLQFYCVQTT